MPLTRSSNNSFAEYPKCAAWWLVQAEMKSKASEPGPVVLCKSKGYGTQRATEECAPQHIGISIKASAAILAHADRQDQGYG